ncbi:CNT_collapsed_G0034650.mRNA.1.CDS.1 [Saccharomyces cerevisiae]|nr:CNT_collapsed_G0034650.mRNA.1.CDS.1 [Saccharomyces cerevisiae]
MEIENEHLHLHRPISASSHPSLIITFLDQSKTEWTIFCFYIDGFLVKSTNNHNILLLISKLTKIK